MLASAPARSAPRKRMVLQVGKFYPPHIGGIETHLRTLCGGLSDSVDVRVLVASDNRVVEEVVDGIPISRLTNLLRRFSAPACPAMISRIQNSGADLVHLHLPNPSAVLAYLASGYRGPLVVTYHSDIVRQKFRGALLQPFVDTVLRRSSAIIATSGEYVQTSPVLSRFRDRCHVIPFGIALEEFETIEPGQVANLRSQFGSRVVLSVGRLVHYKGFECLIRAMMHVRGKLVIVGDGPLRRELENLTAKLRLGRQIFFAGKVKETLPYYHSSDVFALASVARNEAFGIVQLEAMATGLPVVNTSLRSGVPFVSLHGQTGFTVPPSDPEALARALNQLLDDKKLRTSFGAAGRLRVQREFNLQTMVSRTLALYDKIGR